MTQDEAARQRHATTQPMLLIVDGETLAALEHALRRRYGDVQHPPDPVWSSQIPSGRPGGPAWVPSAHGGTRRWPGDPAGGAPVKRGSRLCWKAVIPSV